MLRISSGRPSSGLLQLLPLRQGGQDMAKGICAKPATRRKRKKANKAHQVDELDRGEAAGDDANSPPCLTRSAQGKAIETIPVEGDPEEIATTTVLVRVFY
jgi:hypothetical protein